MRSLCFDNRFIAELPADPVTGAGIREVRGALYSHVDPAPVAEPQLLAWSREVAGLIGLDDADVASPEFAQVFAGNALLPGMQPYAANYGGTSSGIGRASWAMAAPFRWARCSMPPASAGNCN